MPLAGSAKRRHNQDYYSRKGKTRRGFAISTSIRDEKKVLQSMRLPEGMVMRVQQITHKGIATGAYPWRTPNETYQALIVRGFETLKGEAVVDDALPYFKVRKQLDAIASQRSEAQAALSRTRHEVSELVGIGETQVAEQYFGAALKAAQDMPPTAWSVWLVKELKAAFPELAKALPSGVALTPGGTRKKAHRAGVQRKPVRKGRR